MRSVKQTAAFKKCLKREMAGRYRAVILEELPNVVEMLANDIPLPDKYQDHALTGKWQGHNECHIRSDFLLIYLKRGDNELFLARLGSHAELFGM
jgi:mRNA interferase YafQ